LQTLPTIAEVANNYRSCQQLQKLPTAAVVAAVAEKGCNSGFKLVIAENLKTVANTNFNYIELSYYIYNHRFDCFLKANPDFNFSFKNISNHCI
jgi:hypothetical protein